MNTARKLILIATSLPFFAAPAVSFADEAAATTACVDAFVHANQFKDRKLRVQVVDSVRGRFDVHARAYKITLSAKGVESGKQLANGTCYVERDGSVTVMNSKPAVTTLASR